MKLNDIIDKTQKINEFLNQVHCPYCLSSNVEPVNRHKKSFSMGKALGGALLAGNVGSLAGFTGKNTNKFNYVCHNCGKIFKHKIK